MASHPSLTSPHALSGSNSTLFDQEDYPYSDVVDPQIWGRMVSIRPPRYTFMDQLKEWFKSTTLYRKLRGSYCVKAIKNELIRRDLSKAIRQTRELSGKDHADQKAYLEQAIQRNDFSFIRRIIRHNILNDMQQEKEPQFNAFACVITDKLYQTLEQTPEIMQKLLSKVEVRHRENFYNNFIKNKQSMMLMTQLVPKLWHLHRTRDIESELSALFSSSTRDNGHGELLACGLVTTLWANPEDWNVGKTFVAIGGGISPRLMHLTTTRRYETMDTEERSIKLHEKCVEKHKETITGMQTAIEPLKHTPKGKELNRFIDIIYQIRMYLFEQKIGDKKYHFSILNNDYLDQQLEKITPATLSRFRERIKTLQSSSESIDKDIEINNTFGWKPLAYEKMREEFRTTIAIQGELTNQQNEQAVNDFLWQALINTL